MYDVAIVGARCAGAALALMLAREGLKVLMIDRARFPSDTMSGHFIQPAGVSCLRRLGLLEALETLGAPAQNTMTVDFGPVVLSGRPTAAPDGTSAAYAPRRYLFDPMLADAAVAAGAELREAVSFVEPLIEDGRVTGMWVQGDSGHLEAVRARLVVGADGKRSRFARMVGAQAYDSQPAAGCMYYAYWSGFDTDANITRLFVRDGLFAVAVPSNDDLTFVGFSWPHAQFARVRSNIGKAYHEAAATLPWIADRLASATQAERFVGTGDLDGFFRTASGPGWALLGDAGYHKDPITAQGMTDALLHAEMLATAIVAGFSEGGSLDAVADAVRPAPRREGAADVRADLRPRPARAAAARDGRADWRFGERSARHARLPRTDGRHGRHPGFLRPGQPGADHRPAPGGLAAKI